MPHAYLHSIDVVAAPRAELESLARSHRGRADEARRARIILLLTDGYSYSTICERVDCTPQTIATWKTRYEADRHRRLARPPSRVESSRADAAGGSADLELDPEAADGRHDPLVDASAGRQAGRAAHDCRSARGNAPACSRIGWSATCVRPIPISSRRRRRSSGSIWSRRSMRRSSAWTKRRPFRPSIAAIPFCRCRRAAPSDTASSMSATGPCRSTPRWRRRAACHRQNGRAAYQ